MATRSELRTLTQDWLDDVNGGYFTDAKVNTWLNNAQFEVQKRLLKANQNWYTICKETTMVVNQGDYVLPSDCLKIHRVVIVQNVGTTSETETILSPITLNEQDSVRAYSGFPQGYYLKKGRLVVVPRPDTAYVLRLSYSYRLTNMTLDTDQPDAPEQYHELVAVIAAENGFIKDDRMPANLVEKKKQYEAMMDQDAAERRQDQPRTIVETDGY